MRCGHPSRPPPPSSSFMLQAPASYVCMLLYRYLLLLLFYSFEDIYREKKQKRRIKRTLRNTESIQSERENSYELASKVEEKMEAADRNESWRTNLTRFNLYFKRRIKLNRFLLVIDTKKGVSISAITVIVVDLIDLLWNLSMTFGPLTSTMTTLLLVETFLVIAVSSVLLYAMKSQNKSDLRSVLFTWLVVVAIDYCLRASMIFSSLIISEKASTAAKVIKSIASVVMLVLVAHCWLCVFTYYDDDNGKITTVKITPSDDRGRTGSSKRPIMMMKGPVQDLSAINLERADMLRAPTEDAAKSRW